MMELNYPEFRNLVWDIKKNLLITYSTEIDPDNQRTYEICASEPSGSLVYYCRINSVDDATDVYNFETRYLNLVNKQFPQLGTTVEVQVAQTDLLRSILDELQVMNARIEHLVNSGITNHANKWEV